MAALPPPRADSLRGSSVDGAVNFDARGSPLADRDLRRLFDYFLARLGERDIDAIRNDVWAHVRDVLQLDASAQARVLAWFDAYVVVARMSAELLRSGDPVADAARLRELHRARLGDELARAWFGDDDDYAAYTAARLALEHDARLDAAQKSQRRAELDATLDPRQRDDLRASTDFQIAAAQSRALDAAGADTAARFADRAALWGEDAAARLALLDQAEASWNARAAGYARARAGVLGDATLAPTARAARLRELLADFSEAEQRRLLALAAANALPAY